MLNKETATSCCNPASGCCSPSTPDITPEGISRREFLSRTTAISIAAVLAGLPRWAAGSGEVRMSPHLIPKDKNLSPGWIKSLSEMGEPETYSGDTARTIGMPVGGIGAGQIYLCGDGSLGLWEIFNQHQLLPHGALSYARRTIPKPVNHGLAVYWKQDGKTTVHMLNHSGFDRVTFRNTHPVGSITYTSDDSPVRVTLEAFSPFIPLNAKDSALPATIMTVTVENTANKPLDIGTLSWLENPIGRRAHSAWLPGIRESQVIRSDKSGRIVHSAKSAPKDTGSAREPIIIQAFESTSFGDWKIDGTAFGDRPTTGNLPTQQEVKGWKGTGFAGSFRNRDLTTGKLTSPEFTIERNFINFLIGGGQNSHLVGISLFIDGKEVKTAAGKDRELMDWNSWHVAEFEGKTAYIEIYDRSREGWGHIQVDHIEQSDERQASTDTPSRFEEFPDFGTMTWAVDRAVHEKSETDELLKLVSPDTTSGAAALEDSITFPTEEQKTIAIATRPTNLQPGEKLTITHTLTWHFPNTIHPNKEAGHYYAALYPDAGAVLDYVSDNQERLITDTLKWRDTYYASTLPPWLLERIHLTSCCLATGTTMWWENGRFWAFEGVICCVGTCTHVYNYVQTTARLFPELERNIREQQDLKPGVGLEADGLVGFRHDGKYAADGQCGTVLKVYREHKMSGDSSFLKRNWEATKKVMDYAIGQDANANGVLEGRQHNTYDVDFYGPNTFVGALYLAALRAAEEMAREMNDNAYADKVHKIYEAGRQWTEANLWNGEYFKQIVDLEEHKIHQYGDGCLSDQLFGQNWAHQMKLGYLYDPAKVRKTLESIWQYNWAPDLGIYNTVYPAQRVFAEAQEAGLFNCSWPKSQHLDNGVLYRDEVWSGVEYQVASHMIYEGMVTEGLAICRAVHDRYHPARRNPFNEIECSDYYSRAMASWGVLLALSGYEYHGPKGLISFNPAINESDFRCVLNGAEGWGSFQQTINGKARSLEISIGYGQLKLKTIELPSPDVPSKIQVLTNGQPVSFAHEHADKKLRINLSSEILIPKDSSLTISLS